MSSFSGFGKTQWARRLTYILILNLGILMLTLGIYFFKAPNGFATGGVTGLAIILTRALSFLGINQSTYVLIFNSVLLVLGVAVLGRQCGLLTIFCSLMYSIENFLLETFLPISNIPGAVAKLSESGEVIGYTLTSSPLLDLIFAVMLTGIGSAVIFRCNASSGGTDIVALIIKKYTSINVGTALLCTDIIIAASSIFIYNLETGLYSLLGLFAKVFVVDDILDSMNMCKAFTIITTKAEEIDDFIMNNMKRGATVYNAEGAFSHQEKKVIVTVCRRTEALRLRRKVKEIDPGAFIIITKTSEIMGKGFRDAQ
ncbi:MAG: YitT family protein [Clostridia bacterium]|nr:YitT family protein [Clostridia bacterium]